MPVVGAGHRLADVFLRKHGRRAAVLQEGVAFYGRAGNALLKSLQRRRGDPMAIYGTNCLKFADGDEDEDRISGTQELAAMNFPQRLRAAMKGTREQRAILIRDPNKMICASVLSSPKVSVPEVESFARMQNVSEDVLRIIGHNRAWLKSYGVVLALTKNPKSPLALSMQLMTRLQAKDLAKLSVDRNVPEALRISARKKVAQNQSGKD